jgi:hypothetical protein
VQDILFVAVIVAFFVVAALFVAGCERVAAGGSEEESRNQ